jgi:hypothetical protein
MAQIKRDAGAASKQGKEFSWKEYEELRGQLNQTKKQHKKDDKKPNSGSMDAATRYDKKAEQAAANGNTADAMIFSKLAGIKRLASNGKLEN